MTWTTSSHRVFVLFIFLFIAASFAFAQTSTTSLRGTILDPGGAVVPDAEVTLSNPEIGVALATHSDKDGFYQFREVRPSTYTLSVNAPGFAPYQENRLGAASFHAS